MPGRHATLSPSSAERWTTCPASVRMAASVPRPPESVYAAEGTAAHALGELKAQLAFEMISSRAYTTRRNKWRKSYGIDEDTELEMDLHTDAYVALLHDRMSLYDNSQLMLEQKLETGVPSCWGTSDAVIVSPQHVEAIDLKYGAGVAVEAEGNPQLRLYAVGALETYGDILGETEVVRITVFQPRMDHTLTDEMAPDELRAWRDSLLPIAEEALGKHARFNPSEAACRWCPASGRCPAQFDKAMETHFGDDPDVLDPAELAEALAKVPEIKVWLNAVEATALNLAYSEGTPIPGYKVVMSGGRRAIPEAEQEAAIDELFLQGFDFDAIAQRKLRAIGHLEKLMGKDRFEELVGPFVKKGDGKPSLVPESDRREAITPGSEAAQVFGDDA